MLHTPKKNAISSTASLKIQVFIRRWTVIFATLIFHLVLTGSAQELTVDALIDSGEYQTAWQKCGGTELVGITDADQLFSCSTVAVILGEMDVAGKGLAEWVSRAGDDHAVRSKRNKAVAGILEKYYRNSLSADFLGQAVVDSGRDIELRTRWVRALLRSGRNGEAVSAALGTVMDGQPADGTEALREMSLILFRHGEIDGAVKIANRLVEGELSLSVLDAVMVIAQKNRDEALAKKAALNVLANAEIPDDDVWSALSRHGFHAVAAGLMGDRIGASGEDLIRLGRLWMSAGLDKNAEDVFSRMLNHGKDPKWAERIEIAEAWMENGKFAKALKTLEFKASEQVKVPSQAFVVKAKAQLALGKDKDLAVWVEKARAQVDDPVAMWLGVGDFLLDKGKVDLAAESFRKVLGAELVGQRRATALVALARAVVKGAKDEKTAEDLLIAALVGPDSGAEELDKVKATARDIPDGKRLARAILAKSIELDKDRVDLWLELARREADDGNREGAVAAFGEAVVRSGKKTEALGQAVGTLIGKGWLLDAVAGVSRWGGGANLSPEFALKLAEGCLRRGDGEGAGRYFDAFLAAPVNTDFDYAELAVRLARDGMFDGAKKALELAERTLPEVGMWEYFEAAGHVAVMEGEVRTAKSFFKKARDASPGLTALALRVGQSWSDFGRLDIALDWFESSADSDEEGNARDRAQALVLETLRRLGRDGDIKRRLAKVKQHRFMDIDSLKLVAMEFATAGMPEDGAELIWSASGRYKGADGDMLVDLAAALFFRAGQDDSVRKLASDACADGSENLCLALTRRVSGIPDIPTALELVGTRASKEGAGFMLNMDMARYLLALGKIDDATLVAGNAAIQAPNPSAIISVLSNPYRARMAFEQYATVLDKLMARPEFLDEQGLMLEVGRVELERGNVQGAVLVFHALIGLQRGNEARVYRFLASAGEHERAERMLMTASPTSVAAFEAEDLRVVVEDLISTGRADSAEALLERYILGNDGIAAALEVVGGIRWSLGMKKKASKIMARVPAKSLSRTGLSVAVQMAVDSGDAKKAEELVMGVVESGVGDDETARWILGMAGYLDRQGLPWIAERVLRGLDRKREMAETGPYLLEILARLGKFAGPGNARELFRKYADVSATMTEPFRDYLVWEVRTGDPSTLVPAHDERHVSGARKEAALLAMCLADAPEEQLAPLEKSLLLGRRNGALRAATVYMACGRWEKVQGHAWSALEVLSESSEVENAVVLAVRASAMRNHDILNVLERLLSRRTDDMTLINSWMATAAMWAGNTGREVEYRNKMVALAPQDRSAVMGAISAILKGDDEDGLDDAIRLSLVTFDDRQAGRRALAAHMHAHLRDEMAESLLDVAVPGAVGDPEPAIEKYLADLRANNTVGALSSAEIYLERTGGNLRARASLVSLAAGELNIAVIRSLVAPLLEGPSDDDVALALLDAGIAAIRLGENDLGSQWMRSSGRVAVEPSRLVSALARVSIQDPFVNVSYVEDLIRSLGGEDGRFVQIPYVVAARCVGSARDVKAAERCTAEIEKANFSGIGINLAAASALLFEGRYDIAATFFKAVIAEAGADRTVAIATAEKIGSFLNGAPEVPVAERSILARLGLELLKNPAFDGMVAPEDPRFLPVKAQLVSWAESMSAAVNIYLDETKVRPDNAMLRNNMAYSMSIQGYDSASALSAVRSAVALSAPENSFYLETEAWALRQSGDSRKAQKTQARASRLWQVGQGDGLGECFYHFGRIQEDLGNMAPAREAFRRAATLAPLSFEGMRALRALRRPQPRH